MGAVRAATQLGDGRRKRAIPKSWVRSPARKPEFRRRVRCGISLHARRGAGEWPRVVSGGGPGRARRRLAVPGQAEVTTMAKADKKSPTHGDTDIGRFVKQS